MRVLFSEGQEAIKADFNKIQQAKEREFYDRLIYEMLQRSTDKFFAGSMLVTRVNATTVQVAAGLGFQYDAAQVSPECVRRPIYLAANTNATVSAAHGSLNRIDIVSIKAARANITSESRRYKATTAAAPTSQSFVIETDWLADIVVTASTAHASPVAPSTPAGYIKIATLLITAVTGLAAPGDITDNRNLLPLGPTLLIDTSAYEVVPTQAANTPLSTVLSELDAASRAGFASYQAVVGSADCCTHATLAAALADAAVVAGSRILVLSSETLGTMVTISKANMLIEFAPGITFTAGAATTAITIAAAGNRIKGARFSGFTEGISISDTFNHNFITECRFASCTSDVVDNNTTPNNVIFGNITE